MLSHGSFPHPEAIGQSVEPVCKRRAAKKRKAAYEEGCLAPSYMWLEIMSSRLYKPANTELFSSDKLEKLKEDQLDLDQREALLVWLSGEHETKVAPAWSAKGWVREHVGKMKAVAESRKVCLAGAVNQISSTPMGAALKVGGDGLDNELSVNFLKSRNQLFSEPSMSIAVAKLMPDLAPGPFAIDASSHTMLMEHCGRSISDSPEKEAASLHGVTLRSIGQLQARSLESIELLKDAGFPELTFDILKLKMEELMLDKDVENAFSQHAITALGDEDAQASLMDALSAVKENCDQLSSYNMPLTILHGDLASSNILAPEDGSENCKFFDWEHGCIGRPFFDIARFMQEIAEAGVKNVMPKSELIEYLGLWSAHESKNRIVEAWMLAEPLAELPMLSQKYRLLKTVDQENRREIASNMAFNLFCTWMRSVKTT